MKIIISPAKKMIQETDLLPVQGIPMFLAESKKLCNIIQQLPYEERKALWKCNDKLAGLNYERFQAMNLPEAQAQNQWQSLTPAILAYEGLQYQHMKPVVFTESELHYIAEHLCILSGFYGVLAPFDGVTPYRLEMQAALVVESHRNLYEFWGDHLYHAVMDKNPDRILINLASKEYSQAVTPYLASGDTMITCIFGEEKAGKIVQKGTLAKMARGEMVRFLAEQEAKGPEVMKKFTALGFRFEEALSGEREYVFVRESLQR